MKKAERLNDMMIYLNDLEFFNLNDLMEKYNISKSTALRDISSLEELGVPIYAEHGRYGRYGVLKNKLLSPIIFSIDEVHALYFAMLTLNSYESTPFHLNNNKLNEKFEKCLSKKQIDKIHKMKDILKLEVNQHKNVSKYLDKILEAILDELCCEIKYLKGSSEKTYKIKCFKIFARFGQWYMNAIDIETNKYKVFRCDKVKDLIFLDIKYKSTVAEILKNQEKFYIRSTSINFEVEIDDKGKDIFYKEQYKSMELECGEKNIIKGFYNIGEEDFIGNYFIRYGSLIKNIKPNALKEIIENKINDLALYYKKL